MTDESFTPPLPAGVSPEDFAAALREITAIVGEKWVYRDEKYDLDGYRDTYAVVDPDYHMPSAAVAPDGVEQIQRILEVANTYRLPLWPISTGRNLAYGAAAPRMPGTVTLDLKRMNRILEVNEESGYALVEPGVSYFDLYEHLRKNDIKLWLDVPSPGWGSVVGNTLERGVGYTPYADHFLMQCGMEVVLPNAKVIRTGMGALPGNNSWQLFKYGFGPYVDGVFTQSNLGIVTKLGVWLMPEPPGYRPYMISFEREEDIAAAVDVLRPLRINMVVPNAATFASVFLEAAIKTTKSQYYDGSGVLPQSARRQIKEDQKIGEWNLYAALYGPPPIMDANWSVIRDAFSGIKGAKVWTQEDRAGDAAFEYRAMTMSGVPNLREFGFVNWEPSGGHIDFSPITPLNGEDALKQYTMVRDRANEYDFDYLGAFVAGWRELRHVFALVFNREDPQPANGRGNYSAFL